MREVIKNFYTNLLKNKKAIFIAIVCFYALAIILLTLASFYDLSISQALNNPSNKFGLFMRNFGDRVVYVFWAIILILALCFAKGDRLKKIIFLFIIVIVCMAISHGLIELIKNLWGRVRFRHLNDNFTNWFIPNGINGNKSFPSGHTASACNFLPIVLLPFLFNMKKIYSSFCIILPPVYVVLMALARIIVGAHYLSDVTFSALLYVSCLILCVLSIFFIWNRSGKNI